MNRFDADSLYRESRLALDSAYNRALLEHGDIIRASEDYYLALGKLNAEYDAATAN